MKTVELKLSNTNKILTRYSFKHVDYYNMITKKNTLLLKKINSVVYNIEKDKYTDIKYNCNISFKNTNSALVEYSLNEYNLYNNIAKF